VSGARNLETDDRPDLAGFRGDGGVTLDIPETMDANPEPEDETPKPQGDRPLSARERIMQAAVERANEMREKELAQAAIYDEDAREAGLVLPTDEDETPQPTPVARQPEPTPAPVIAPTRATSSHGIVRGPRIYRDRRTIRATRQSRHDHDGRAAWLSATAARAASTASAFGR
jgi:hypothetical protein